MKENELRIGNYVNVPNKSQCPFRIDGFEYWNNNGGKVEMKLVEWGHPLTWEFSELSPIPLTEEILLRCGFEWSHNYDSWGHHKLNIYISQNKGNGYWRIPKGGFSNDNYDNKFYATAEREYSVSSTPIEYLHQLQNLYSALTNEELIIKL